LRSDPEGSHYSAELLTFSPAVNTRC